MSEDLSPEEMLKIRQQENNQDINQAPETSLESTLMSFLANPERMSKTIKQVIDRPSNGKISETVEGTILTPNGLEDIKQENIFMLDDGTSMIGIAQCQNCGSIIKEENLKRCGCGKTCCVVQGCGKVSNNHWYCCAWHSFLGFFGIGLR